jgi:hypothetical protein
VADPAFTSLERDDWNRNAAAHDDVILAWTSQAFAPLLDSLGDLRGRRLLDVASGTGHLVRAAADRGAIAEAFRVLPEHVIPSPLEGEDQGGG